MDTRHGTSQARIQDIKRLISEKSHQPLSQEVIGTCMDFVVAYKSETNPLPIDPVALLLAYESYQNKLAEEAAGIVWLEGWLNDRVIQDLRRAAEDSVSIIGCDMVQAGDSLSLWCRGVINRVVRGMSKW